MPRRSFDTVVVALLLLVAELPTSAYAQIGAAAERAAARAAVTSAEREAAERASKTGAGEASRRAATDTADRVVTRWSSSLCKSRAACPLPEGTANSFVGGSYDEVVLGKDTVLYRAFHERTFKLGNPAERFTYWSRTATKGTHAAIDSAIPVSKNGNLADRVVAIRVPRGTRVFEGSARGIEQGPVGGGSQVVLEGVKPEWEMLPDAARRAP